MSIEISDPEVERRCIERWGAGHWADLSEDKKRDERAFASADTVIPTGQERVMDYPLPLNLDKAVNASTRKGQD